MHQIPVNRFIGRIGTDNLHLHGPILEVEIFLPESVAHLRGQNIKHNTHALIDTGASGTCISPEVAKVLELQPLRQIEMAGVHGVKKSNVYAINFTFPGSGIVLADWNVSEVNLQNRPFHMLLGRDVLRYFLLVYDGNTGEIGLEFPSSSKPLRNKPWVVVKMGGEKQRPNLKKIKEQKKKKRNE